ncbi:MAG: hypothetical protein QW607_03780 [Desulfurococcaceae archaeon]
MYSSASYKVRAFFVLLGLLITFLGLYGGIMLVSSPWLYILFLLSILLILTIEASIMDRINSLLLSGFKLMMICSVITLLLASQLPNIYSYTGWDVNGEARIYKIIESRGLWDPQDPPEMYNSILSTTIFPLIYTQVTGVSEMMFFKYLPILFLAFGMYFLLETNKNIFPKWVLYIGFIILLSYPNLRTELTSIPRQAYALFLYSLSLVEFLNARYFVGSVLLWTTALYHYATGFIFIPGTILSFMISLIIRNKISSKSTWGHRISRRMSVGIYAMVSSLLILVVWYWYAVSPSVTYFVISKATVTFYDIVDLIVEKKQPFISQMVNPLTEPNVYSVIARWINRISLIVAFGSLTLGYIYAYIYCCCLRGEKRVTEFSIDCEKQDGYTAITLGIFTTFMLSLISESFAHSVNPGRLIVSSLYFIYPYIGLGFIFTYKVVLKTLGVSRNMLKGLIFIITILFYISNTGITFEITSSNTFIWPTRLSSAVNLESNPEATYEALVFVGTPVDHQIMNIVRNIIVDHKISYDFGSHLRYWNLDPNVNYSEKSDITFLSYANIKSGHWRYMNGTLVDVKDSLLDNYSQVVILVNGGEYFRVVKRL